MDPIPRCRLPDHEQNEITDVCLLTNCKDHFRTICEKCIAEGRHSQHTRRNYQEFKKQYNQLVGEDNPIQEMLALIDKKIQEFQSLREDLQNQYSQFGNLMFPDEENFNNVNDFIKHVVEQDSFQQRITKDLSSFIITLSKDLYQKFPTLTVEKVLSKPKRFQQLNQILICQLQQKAHYLYQKTRYENALKTIEYAEKLDNRNMTSLKIKYDIFRVLQKHSQAIQTCSKVLSEEMDDKARAEWYDNRAFCYRHSGEKEKAGADLVIAYKLDSSRTDCLQKLKYLYNPQDFEDIETMNHKFRAFSYAYFTN